MTESVIRLMVCGLPGGAPIDVDCGFLTSTGLKTKSFLTRKWLLWGVSSGVQSAIEFKLLRFTGETGRL
jgi:hypothetical protein